MNNLVEFIFEKRPSLSKNSIQTYKSILKNLYIKVFGIENVNFENFNNSSKILNYLKDTPPSTRKTILSALTITTGLNEYREAMNQDLSTYRHEISKQIKSDSQKESWVSFSSIKEKNNELKAIAEPLMRKKKHTLEELQIIQNYIILCLTSGIFIAPRRSKDWTEMVIKNVDGIVNYIDNNFFQFTTYKTVKTYGIQTVEIPKPLLKILKKWIKINPAEYLLFDNKMHKLTSQTLNQKINQIFGKKISTTMLRHSFLTDQFGGTIALNKKIEQTMTAMGSSASQLPVYVKND